MTSGADIGSAEEKLNAVVLSQIGTCFADGNFWQLRFKAPAQFWKKMEHAAAMDKTNLKVEIPPVVLPVSRCIDMPVIRAAEDELELAATAGA